MTDSMMALDRFGGIKATGIATLYTIQLFVAGRAKPGSSQNFEYSGKWSDLSELGWGEHTKIVNIIDTYGVKDFGGLQV